MILHRLLLALLCVLTLGRALAETYTWSNVPIHGGGFVTGLIYHPTTSGILYSRTDVGGAFRWDNTSGTWIPLTDHINRTDSQLTGVVSLALDPSDPDRVYLATGQYLPWWARNAALLRSTNRGATWTQAELPVKLGGNADGRSAGERLQVDPNRGSILFLGTNQDGLYKSTDSGATWSKVTTFTPTSVTSVLFDGRGGTAGQATSRIFVGTTNNAGNSLWQSTDGGATWSTVAGQPSSLFVYRLALDADGTLYSTWNNGLGPNDISSGAVWKRSSTGTWTNITPPTGQGGFAGLSLSPALAGLVVVSTIDRWWPGDVVYRSTDYGATWTAVLASNQLNHDETPWAAASTPHWLGDVQVNPFDAADSWFVTGYGVFRSTNLQATGTSVLWSFRNRGLEETVPLALVSPQAGALLLSAIGDIDGFRHTSLTTPPTSRHQPRVGTNRAIDLAGTEDNVAARLSDSNGYYSLDQGVTWTQFPSKPSTPSGTGRIAVNADGNAFLWTPAAGVPQRSTNRGTSWTAATGLPSASGSEWNVVTDKVNKNLATLYHRSLGTVYRSTDGGVTWSVGATGLPSEDGHMRAVIGKEGHLWLAIYGQGLFRSTNGGTSFTRISSATTAYRVGLGRAATTEGYPAVYMEGIVNEVTGLFRSTDEGATWTRINDDLHQFGWINDISGDPKTFGRVYLATGGRGIVVGEPQVIVAPAITAHPVTVVAAEGAAAQVQVTASGEGTLSYQWYKDGVAVAGATSATLSLSNINTSADAWYTVAVTNAGGTTTSRPARLVVGSSSPSRIINLSVRTQLNSSGSPLIVGFVMLGGEKDILLRAIGPGLAPFLSGYLNDPKMTLFDRNGVTMVENDNWDSAGSLGTLFPAVGAFGLPANSKDAARLVTVGDQHTVHVAAADGNTNGTLLVELYDAASGATKRLRNISARTYAGTGNQTLIAGFAIDGTDPKTVLIRAVGPSLNTLFGISGVMTDPRLTLVRTFNGVNRTLAENDDWGSEAGAGAAFGSAGAFALPSGTKDAALLVTLSNGVYSAIVERATGNYGEAIVEVYEIVPPEN